jgi:exopolysaccharide biosynthesis polyprenyl glycosylphosphotransferase
MSDATGQSQSVAEARGYPGAATVEGMPVGAQSWTERRDRPRNGDARGYVLRRLLAVSDLIALVLGWGIAQAGMSILAGRHVMPDDQLLFILLLPLWTYISSLLRLYHLPDRRLDHSLADEIGPVALAATVWSWAFLLTRAAFTSGAVEVMPSVAFWVTSIVTVLALRSLTRRLARGRRWYRQRVTVIGTPADIGRVVRRIDRHPEYGLDIVRAIEIDDPDPSSDRDSSNGDEARIGPEELAEVVTFSGVSRVIIASSRGDLDERSHLIRRLVEENVHVDLVSGDPEVSSRSALLHHVEGLPMLTVPPVHAPKASTALKRLSDIVVAAAGLLLLSPLFAYCILRIRLESQGPVFFRQRRVGRDGNVFELLKFRTMVEDADVRKSELGDLNVHAKSETPGMFKIPADPRVTNIGAWLRRWSLDELPQLWNVLKGEMSLVGPRPLIPEEAELVSGHYTKRLRMRPGITGPWQTLGRSDIGFEDMVKLDYTYVMNWSFAEDVRLLLRTIGAVAEGRGAY